MLDRRASINLYAERPAQARSFECQYTGAGLDPLGRSPAEAFLGEVLLALLLDPSEFGPPNFINLFLPYGAIASMAEMPPIELIQPGVINVSPGCWVDAYRSDYLIDVKAPGSDFVARGTLECDGHAYHDTTEAQASHDRKRDREMQALGIMVLRYTADDIAEDAMGVCQNALNILLQRSMAEDVPV